MVTNNIPGFTLIELLIIVAIIVVLAEIAIPNLAATQIRSKVVSVRINVITLANDLESCFVDSVEYVAVVYWEDSKTIHAPGDWYYT